LWREKIVFLNGSLDKPDFKKYGIAYVMGVIQYVMSSDSCSVGLKGGVISGNQGLKL
jgi:hypothetical protein